MIGMYMSWESLQRGYQNVIRYKEFYSVYFILYILQIKVNLKGVFSQRYREYC